MKDGRTKGRIRSGGQARTDLGWIERVIVDAELIIGDVGHAQAGPLQMTQPAIHIRDVLQAVIHVARPDEYAIAVSGGLHTTGSETSDAITYGENEMVGLSRRGGHVRVEVDAGAIDGEAHALRIQIKAATQDESNVGLGLCRRRCCRTLDRPFPVRTETISTCRPASEFKQGAPSSVR